jgi:hypothetical protein
MTINSKSCTRYIARISADSRFLHLRIQKDRLMKEPLKIVVGEELRAYALAAKFGDVL